MRILLTNDDGVHAEGLKLLERIAAHLSDDVWIVAPETDQSGVAHSISLSSPLRLREIAPRHFAVQGTPSDCVLMAIKRLLHDKKPDLVLSGINSGQNVAEDVTYSGTIAAAIEATLLGVPAIALSQCYSAPSSRQDPQFYAAAEAYAPPIIRKILDLGIPPDRLVNVNFPPCTAAAVKGVVITQQGRRDPHFIRLEERHDGRHIPYYWIMFQNTFPVSNPHSDIEALAGGCVSVTPLRVNLTDEGERQRYAQHFLWP